MVAPSGLGFALGPLEKRLGALSCCGDAVVNRSSRNRTGDLNVGSRPSYTAQLIPSIKCHAMLCWVSHSTDKVHLRF